MKHRQQQITTVRGISVSILLVLFVFVARSAQAQPQIGPLPQIRPQPGFSQQRADSTFFPRNRELTRILARAEESITEKRYSDAVQYLQSVLDTVDREADAFFVKPSSDGSEQVNISIRSYAQSLLASLPSDGRKAYELLVGPSARELLERGIESGKTTPIEAAARRYPLTKAGRQAGLMLARLNMDRNEPMEAALQYSRLMKFDRNPKAEITLQTALCWAQAKLPDAATRVLLELRERSDSIQIGQQNVRLFARGEDPLGWLESTLRTAVPGPPRTVNQWDRPFGNAERNAQGAPLTTIGDSLWSTSLFDVVDVDDNVKAHMEQFAVQFTPQFEAGVGRRMPIGQPLVVGDKVIYRAYGKLQAVSLAIGELAWESATLDPAISNVIRYQEQPPTDNRIRRPVTSTLNNLFDQRAWRDLTTATISSDGRHVFSIEEVGLASGGMMSIRNSSTQSASTFNLLRAYDVESGKTVWQVGGELRDKSSSMAGYFFLGPPLLLGDRLYILAEMQEQILLLALREEQDVDNRWLVRPVWSLVIANSGTSIAADLVRRLSGISPTYADGKLICPTSAGACVAVDLVDRTPVWGYQYKQPAPGMLRGRSATGRVSQPGWLESTARVAGNVVVLTPSDFDEIHCLDLATGRRLWKQQHQDRRYVAAADSERIVIVCNSRVEALDPRTGELLWETSLGDELVAACGVMEGDRYHIPLATGKLATLKMTNGRILSKVGNIVSGNLISTDRALLSLSPVVLAAYPSRADTGRRLNSSDAVTPDALVQKAVYQLQHGDIEPSLVNLRKAIELDEDRPISRRSSSARELLRDTLLAGLRVDSTNSKSLEELGRLLANDDSEAAREAAWHLAVLNVGRLMTANRYADAFRELLDAADSKSPFIQMMQVDAKRQIRFDRWLFAGVRRIIRQAPATELAGLDQLATAKLTRLKEQSETQLSSDVIIAPSLPTNSTAPADEQRLAKLVTVLSGLGGADRLHKQWLETLDPATDPLPLEFALLNRRRRPELQAETTWRLAQLYATQRRYDLITPLLNDLRSKFGDVMIVGKKTGSVLAEEISSTPTTSEGLKETQAEWDDRVLVVKKIARRRLNGIARSSFKPFANASRLFSGWSFRWDPGRQTLHATDSFGHRRWQTRIQLDPSLPNDIASARIWSVGHLILLQHRLGLTAIDGFGGSDPVLWSLTSERSGLIRGSRTITINPTRLGVLAMRPNGLLYATSTELIFADPLTGQILWRRDASGVFASANPNLTVVGDRFAAIPAVDGKSVLRIDLLDGDIQHIGLKNSVANYSAIVSPVVLPDLKRALGTHDANVVSVKQQSDSVVLDATNLITDSVTWTQSMNADAVVSMIQEGFFSVIQTKPDGQRELRIHDVSNGKMLAAADVKIPDRPTRLSILVTPRQFCVLVHHGKQEPVNIAMSAAFRLRFGLSGSMYVFDRRTKQLLWEKTLSGKVLVRDHSSALPIFVLFNIEPIQRNAVGVPFNSFFRRRKYGISIFDARDGSELFASSDIGPGLANVRIVAEQPAGTISVQLQSETIMLGADSVINRVVRPEIDSNAESKDESDPVKQK
jgi:outer membrane protein assembly factor BamB